jgi:hypothetical protein
MRKLFLLIFFVFSIINYCLANKALLIQAAVNRSTATIGQPVILSVILPYDEGKAVSWLLVDAALKRSKDVIIYTISYSADNRGMKHNIILTSSVPTTLFIPALPVLVSINSKTDTVYTKPLRIKFTPGVVLTKLNPIKPNFKNAAVLYGSNLAPLLIVGLSIALILLATLAIIKYILRRIVPETDALGQSLSKIIRLQQAHSAQTISYNETVNSAFQIIQEFLCLKFNIINVPWTERQILPALQFSDLSGEELASVKTIINSSERLRFSKGNNEDLTGYLMLIAEFLTSLSAARSGGKND